jgi:hypothetical protein
MFSIRRFFSSRRSQPCIQDRNGLDVFMQAEQEEAAWQLARYANSERRDSPNGVNQDDDLPLGEAQRLSGKQVLSIGQQKTNDSGVELDTD